jgi:hypothetical protein
MRCSIADGVTADGHADLPLVDTLTAMDLPRDLMPKPSAEVPVEVPALPRVWGWGGWSVVFTLAALAAGTWWLAWSVVEEQVDEAVGVTFALIAAGILALWLVNLVRWGLGALGRASVVRADLCAGEARGMDLVFFEFTWRGRLRYQQVVWEPWISALPITHEVLVRRCLGIRDMFLIDVPGHGRLWPARAAHGKPPWKVPVGPATFEASGMAWARVAAWSVPPQTLMLLKYGPYPLAVTVPLQAAIFLMLGVAFTGIADEG